MCAYYAAACFQCSPGPNGEEPLVPPDDDFCENVEAYCQATICCDNALDVAGKSTCVDQLIYGDGDSDGPTFEPTMETVEPKSVEPTIQAPDVGGVEPTSSPTMEVVDTSVPTAADVAPPTTEEVDPLTDAPTVVFITSSPTQGDDTTSSPTVAQPDTAMPVAQPTEVVESITGAPTKGVENEVAPSPEPTIPEPISPPSTSAASLAAAVRNDFACMLVAALAGCITLSFM
mmetsp:Transcript_13109/g.37374  ORF Transcript_13109/g.37374 Transcript_13109/m.37374 type:complete len:231 (-) Transcript_13109:1090-1782(-)